MRGAAIICLLFFLVVWGIPFAIQAGRNRGLRAVEKAPASRWGIATQAVAFAVAWWHPPRDGAGWLIMPGWRLAGVIVCGLIAVALGTAAVTALGRHWRYEAALIAGHRLVQSGPYAIVRNPIYTSMIAMLLATGFAVSGWVQFGIAAVLCIAGIEIRVREEERLLAAHFGPEYEAYRARVPAYLPWLR